MGVYKEIPSADGSGITSFYRLSQDFSTTETTSTDNSSTKVDYDKEIINKPSINGVALTGNKTLEDLGIQTAGEYLTAIPEEYITEEELVNKDYATRAYVIEQVGKAEHFSREIVQSLPVTGKDNVIYLVLKEGEGKDIYDEYLWINETVGYEFLGTTAVDLSNYYTKEEVEEKLAPKVDKVVGKQLSTNDYTNEEKLKLASLENYDDSELQNKVAALHNYDDSYVVADIEALETKTQEMDVVLTNLVEEGVKHLDAIRLVRDSSTYTWKDVVDNTLDYDTVRDALGRADCILYYEDVEKDGKTIPALYKIEGEVIFIRYIDLDDYENYITATREGCTNVLVGRDTYLGPDVMTNDDLPDNAYVGEIRIVRETKNVYVFDGTEWLAFNQAGEIDTSLYLRRDNTYEFTPVDDYNPAHKKYVDDSVSKILFEGKQGEYDNLSEEQRASYLIAIVEPFVELKEEEMVQFNSILGTEEIQTTEIDMTEPEVEEQLDEIIGGEV